jgi:hypothetical protein
MFSTGHDAATHDTFKLEPADAPDLLGVTVRGAKRTCTQPPKGLRCTVGRCCMV